MSQILYIDDLRSDQFLDLPIISQWGKIKWLIFEMLVVITASIIQS